jgi:hypothetical protein
MKKVGQIPPLPLSAGGDSYKTAVKGPLALKFLFYFYWFCQKKPPELLIKHLK